MHAVVRGSPTAAQRYLEEELTAAGSRDHLGQVFLHCLRTRPDDIMMINGHSGQSFTNSWMLSRAVRLSRALSAQGVRAAVTVAANHEHLVVANLAAVMAGVVPLGLDPGVTVFELKHFFSIWPPDLVFCDAERRADVESAVTQQLKNHPTIVVLDKLDSCEVNSIDQFIKGHSDDLVDFKVAAAASESLVLMLPTSGSTGPPKATLLTHSAIIAQIPTLWMHYNTFPSPVSKAWLMASAQWMTWWSLMTSMLMYRITLVVTRIVTPETSLDIIEKYQVQWVMMSPSLSARVLSHISAVKVKSVRFWLTTGAAVGESTLAALQDYLQEGSYARQGYGMTELQGFFSVPDVDTPFTSVGIPSNIFHFKIVDGDGQELGPNQKGELYIKSRYVSKGYYNNEEASRESITADGWLTTGDIFYKDEAGRIFFVERKKFWFKLNNYHVSPEEIELVISGVRGVEQCVVCGTEEGAGALVVTSPGETLTRAEIHRAVNSTLADYKHLHSGIAFVTFLPLTHSGKIKRKECQVLMEQLIKEKVCFK